MLQQAVAGTQPAEGMPRPEPGYVYVRLAEVLKMRYLAGSGTRVEINGEVFFKVQK